MKTCWKFEADKRPSFSDLVEAIDHLTTTLQMTQKKVHYEREYSILTSSFSTVYSCLNTLIIRFSTLHQFFGDMTGT